MREPAVGSSEEAVGHSTPWPYAPWPGRPRGTWPGGAGVAVYVALGVEHYREGSGGRTEDLLPPPAGSSPAATSSTVGGAGHLDLANVAWREYGNRVGAFALLDHLAALRIPPTLLLNTDVYSSAPAVTDHARALGAEVVGHGTSNSDSLTDVGSATHPDTPSERERAYLEAVASTIETNEGFRPAGWSSPWLAHTPATLGLLAATGYRYVLDLRLDDQPTWLRTSSGPLLCIPYALEVNDSTSGVGRLANGREFADMVVDEVTELLDAHARDGIPRVGSVVVHSFVSGTPHRVRPLHRALQHLAALPGLEFTQPRAIHAAVTAPGGAHLAVPLEGP